MIAMQNQPDAIHQVEFLDKFLYNELHGITPFFSGVEEDLKRYIMSLGQATNKYYVKSLRADVELIHTLLDKIDGKLDYIKEDYSEDDYEEVLYFYFKKVFNLMSYLVKIGEGNFDDESSDKNINLVKILFLRFCNKLNNVTDYEN